MSFSSDFSNITLLTRLISIFGRLPAEGIERSVARTEYRHSPRFFSAFEFSAPLLAPPYQVIDTTARTLSALAVCAVYILLLYFFSVVVSEKSKLK